ncbi:MAG: cytochrome c oxidase subunit II [Xanthobacteraceae bacterium]|nr:cytochrome c oxidase subunit II [Xanthobacteraceae bacterium]
MLPQLSQLFSGLQSALDPGSPQARAIAQLSWIMFAGAAAIFLLVMLFLAWALWAPAPRRRWLANRSVVVAGGIAFPIVVLTALLVYGLLLARDIVAEPQKEALQVHVVGEQFWWRVRYRDGAGVVETANELHIPVGRPVRLSLTTADVIHSFWVPGLGGKLDMIPGQTNTLTLTADRPGVYRGQCAEFCGAAHALMAFDVVAHAPEAFAAWLRAQAEPARDSIFPLEQRGRALFLASGCGACHVVRGTAAAGRLGPDLTHVGSRRTIAAGTYPNNKGTLAGWIADSQHLKPNNKMPSFDVLAGEDLRAIASYLASLR